MRPFLLLTAHDCHLCDHGRQILDTITADGLLTWREVDADTEEGHRLATTAPPLRPVLFDPDGRVIAYGRLSARRLRRQIHATSDRFVDRRRESSNHEPMPATVYRLPDRRQPLDQDRRCPQRRGAPRVARVDCAVRTPAGLVNPLLTTAPPRPPPAKPDVSSPNSKTSASPSQSLPRR
jgi:hypothetical protein